MTKIILPLLAVLALLGSAQAQPMSGSAKPADSRGTHFPGPADMPAQHRQFCQDAYAHAVGDLAYLEARLNLTHQEQPLFDRWKNVKLMIAKHNAVACATTELPRPQNKPPTLLEIMSGERENLKHRLADLDNEIPVFDAFYNGLSQAQKDALDHPGQPAILSRRFGFAGNMNRDVRRDRGPGGGPGGGPNGPPQQ